ncbi:MAG: flagellar basal body rod protein FlgC [Turneriella sp.]|nr:flagellar basal body rod protein FlgC [Leptospiraceae bacterium]MCX7632933.1 flagellar basal body rod protein FlgC [Turneriella sp.]
MFESINIAATGLSAQRLKMDVISNNIANATTTRTNEGDGPYRRRRVILEPINLRTRWKSPVYPFGLRAGDGEGVRVLKIERDETTPVRLVYDPSHPDAIKVGPKKGYVEYPNVDIVTEMVDMIAASRSYEANAQVIQGAKTMFQSALQIGRA